MSARRRSSEKLHDIKPHGYTMLHSLQGTYRMQLYFGAQACKVGYHGKACEAIPNSFHASPAKPFVHRSPYLPSPRLPATLRAYEPDIFLLSPLVSELTSTKHMHMGIVSWCVRGPASEPPRAIVMRTLVKPHRLYLFAARMLQLLGDCQSKFLRYSEVHIGYSPHALYYSCIRIEKINIYIYIYVEPLVCSLCKTVDGCGQYPRQTVLCQPQSRRRAFDCSKLLVFGVSRDPGATVASPGARELPWESILPSCSPRPPRTYHLGAGALKKP